ncbi:MAG: D-hexose-6-phosphate mutarotase [Roseiflexaceae bacterium]
MASTAAIAQLNAEFGIPEQVEFTQVHGDLVAAQVSNRHARATIMLQGAHVVAYQQQDAAPLLFVSRQSLYTPGKPIRGGVPLCWPWFGPHPSDPSKPAHGFARIRQWHMLATQAQSDGSTELRLGLAADAATMALWPHAFRLELHIQIGATLRVDLIMHNSDTAAWSCTGALHSYFTVGDIEHIRIGGLAGSQYIDKVDQNQVKLQDGPIQITSEVDRVYQRTTSTCVITDPILERQISIAKQGSNTTVVWNPWQAKAAQLADLADDEYRSFVCVETANAHDDQILLPPGGEHRLTTILST